MTKLDLKVGKLTFDERGVVHRVGCSLACQGVGLHQAEREARLAAHLPETHNQKPHLRSEAGSYLRPIDFVDHSTLGVRVIKKKHLRLGSPDIRRRRRTI